MTSSLIERSIRDNGRVSKEDEEMFKDVTALAYAGNQSLDLVQFRANFLLIDAYPAGADTASTIRHRLNRLALMQ